MAGGGAHSGGGGRRWPPGAGALAPGRWRPSVRHCLRDPPGSEEQVERVAPNSEDPVFSYRHAPRWNPDRNIL